MGDFEDMTGDIALEMEAKAFIEEFEAELATILAREDSSVPAAAAARCAEALAALMCRSDLVAHLGTQRLEMIASAGSLWASIRRNALLVSIEQSLSSMSGYS